MNASFFRTAAFCRVAVSAWRVSLVSASLILVAAGAPAAAPPPQQPDGDPTLAALATADPLAAGLLEQMLADQVARGVPITPQVLRLLHERVVSQSLMAQAATQAGLDKRPDVRIRIAQARRMVLAQAWLQAQAELPNPAVPDGMRPRAAFSGPSGAEAEISNAR